MRNYFPQQNLINLSIIWTSVMGHYRRLPLNLLVHMSNLRAVGWCSFIQRTDEECQYNSSTGKV